jgi:hypothetical protein
VSDILLRDHYACFNERRFDDAARLFADDAVVEHIPFGHKHRGPQGYENFVDAWITAFPDGMLIVDRIERRDDTLFEVHLLGTGTHRGVLDIGAYRFKPTGVNARLRLRELFDIRDGKIASATLAFDLNDLISQLATVDYADLIAKLDRIRLLADELSRSAGDAAKQRDVVGRLGPELDAARKALRPHYNW